MMHERWVKPEFEEVSVGAECTAYAGAVRDRDGLAGAAPVGEPAPAGPLVRAEGIAPWPAR